MKHKEFFKNKETRDFFIYLLLNIENLDCFRKLLEKLDDIELGGSISCTNVSGQENFEPFIICTFDNIYLEDDHIYFLNEDEYDEVELLEEVSVLRLPLTEIKEVYSYYDERMLPDPHVGLKIILKKGEADIIWCF